MSNDPFAKVEELVRKERISREARDAISHCLSSNIVSPTVATCFFNSLLLRLEILEDGTRPTADVDGKRLRYNPEYLMSLTPGQREWLLDHEAVHVALGHPARMCYCEDAEVANVAADLITNQLLWDAGLREYPAGALFPGQGEYRDIPQGLDFETCYERLMKKKQSQQNPDNNQQGGEDGTPGGDDGSGDGDGGTEETGGSDDAGGQPDSEGDSDTDDHGDGLQDQDQPSAGGPGDGDESDPSEGSAGVGSDSDERGGEEVGGARSPGPGGAGTVGGTDPAPDPGKCGGVMKAGDGSPAAASEQEADAQQMLAEAASIASKMGDLPGSLQKCLRERRKRPQDWRERLRDFMTRRDNSRLSWEKVQPWAIHRGLYLPGRAGRSLGKVIFVVDTSGSCWGDAMRAFAGELQSIVEEFPSTQLTILHCDARIQGVETWDPQERAGEEFDLTPRGGGGTSHRPVFEWIEREAADADAVVLFTDLYTDFPERAPTMDCLWAVSGENRSRPPFGEVVYLEGE